MELDPADVAGFRLTSSNAGVPGHGLIFFNEFFQRDARSKERQKNEPSNHANSCFFHVRRLVHCAFSHRGGLMADHVTARHSPAAMAASLADVAYAQLKRDIFEFRLIPGDRFSETSIAQRLGVSRTPVRDALSRLQREGYLEVHFRSGWSVKPFDFEQFEHLYDLRMVLETTAVRRLCDQIAHPAREGDRIAQLKALWLIPKEARLADGALVADMDECFHVALVEAAGNPELARVHKGVTERIQIIRRLDFTSAARIEATYDEHAQILRAVLDRRADQAVLLLTAHIGISKAEVRKITLHRLYAARQEHPL
jgi:DNA-binding GntR family transcriptional regulator